MGYFSINARNCGIRITGNGSRVEETRIIRKGNRIKKETIIRDRNGNWIGSFSSSRLINKTKPLQYSFKKISNRILAANSSGTARKALTAAQGATASLRRKQHSSEYDDRDLDHAIIHAERMERIARKKMKHLKEEEKAERQQGPCPAELEEKEAKPEAEALEQESEATLSDEELRKLMQELKDMLEESADMLKNLAETDTLTEEIVGTLREDMDPADLEQLKKKHRAEEMREIIEADMKYLKALFDKLAKEKQQASASGSVQRPDNGSVSGSGVSLEIDGVDMPVAAMETGEAVPEGGSVDVSL